MQANNFSRRVAITGLCAAVAVPVTAVGAPSSRCSYPDLADKLGSARGRYIAQYEKCKASRAAGMAYATAKTGITEDEARAEQRNSFEGRTEDGPKCEAWFGAWQEYSKAHDDDPVDEHGSSIEWSAINDELNPLCRSIVALPVLSVADLGLMAQAYVALNATDLIDPQWADESREARQLAEAVCKFCGVEPFPGLDYAPLAENDEDCVS